MSQKSIAIACDHRGLVLKKELIPILKAEGFEVKDFGTNSEASCDYPDYGLKAAEAVGQGACGRGIVICHSGIGMSIMANKIKGVRAALCGTMEAALFSRKHNDANVLALGSGFVDPPAAKQICRAWLATAFEGGRHERRINKILSYEQNGRIDTAASHGGNQPSRR